MIDVLLFAPVYPPYEGPTSPVYYESLADELAVDHRVHVVAPYSSDAPTVEHREALTVYRFLPRRDALPSPVRAPLETSGALLVALVLTLVRGIDVYHVQSTSFGTVGFALAAALTRTALYYDCRDANFPRWLIRRGPTVKWFSVSESVDDELVAAGVPRVDIVRLPVTNPNYVGEYARSPGLTDDPGCEVVFVGRLIEKKGVLTLAEAVAQLEPAEMDLSVTYVGDGPDRESLVARVADLSIAAAVEFSGMVPHREAIARLAGADVLVLPSEDEGVPRVVVEAFEVGVPVVATPVGGIPEVVRHEDTGLLVENEPTAVAAAIDRLRDDGDLARGIATRARSLATRRSSDLIRENVAAAYQTS